MSRRGDRGDGGEGGDGRGRRGSRDAFLLLLSTYYLSNLNFVSRFSSRLQSALKGGLSAAKAFYEVALHAGQSTASQPGMATSHLPHPSLPFLSLTSSLPSSLASAFLHTSPLLLFPRFPRFRFPRFLNFLNFLDFNFSILSISSIPRFSRFPRFPRFLRF